ncbi:MAG: endopeptidase La [Thermotoga sp.]|nr:MAG: endopeptidase La [Thermotoga sp.]
MASKFEKLEEYAKLGERKEISIPQVLSAIPLRSNLVIFPHTVISFFVGRERSLASLEYALEKRNRFVLLVTQKDTTIEDPTPEDLYDVGTVAEILQLLKLPDGNFKVLVQGLKRAKIDEVVESDALFLFKITTLKPRYSTGDKKIKAYVKNVQEAIRNYAELSKNIPMEALSALEDTSDPDKFADLVCSLLQISLEKKEALLKAVDPIKRLNMILTILFEEIDILKVEDGIKKRVKKHLEKNQREYYLKEKLKAIHEELGTEESDPMIMEFKEKLRNGNYPKYVEEKAEHEIKKLREIPNFSAEGTVIMNYLDWILNLPWNDSTKDRLDISVAKKILDKDHYGLKQVKERILEYIAVRKLNPGLKSPIICLVGPPGVGKTSLGRSLARAMNRKFVRMSLGGLRDEAEIRGHRRTYVGAMPGRIIQLIHRANSNNCVILLDEVDKMGQSFQGDPASALLEVLDPEQNSDFVDNYLGIPFDLSRILFITTANVLYTIPPALRDRMEVIRIPGYTTYEKIKIAKGFLIPKLLKHHGLDTFDISVTDSAIKVIIREYTREAGLRNLERTLAAMFRKVAREILEKGIKKIRINSRNVKKFLGVPLFSERERLPEPMVGVAMGLAWTEAGGEVLQIESTLIPGKGEVVLTGNLGDIMKESARIALTVVRTKAKKFGCEPLFIRKNDIHLHVPEGAIPKDGPSAGISMATSIMSALSKKKVRNDVAMTGEITLNGRVLPIGGVKEKVMAAHRVGIKTIILPRDNEPQLSEIPDEIEKDMSFVLVKDVDEVFKNAFLRK